MKFKTGDMVRFLNDNNGLGLPAGYEATISAIQGRESIRVIRNGLIIRDLSPLIVFDTDPLRPSKPIPLPSIWPSLILLSAGIAIGFFNLILGLFPLGDMSFINMAMALLVWLLMYPTLQFHKGVLAKRAQVRELNARAEGERLDVLLEENRRYLEEQFEKELAEATNGQS